MIISKAPREDMGKIGSKLGRVQEEGGRRKGREREEEKKKEN
jgi:hypothetical protein